MEDKKKKINEVADVCIQDHVRYTASISWRDALLTVLLCYPVELFLAPVVDPGHGANDRVATAALGVSRTDIVDSSSTLETVMVQADVALVVDIRVVDLGGEDGDDILPISFLRAG